MKKEILDEYKQLIRIFEGICEIAILTYIYHLISQMSYPEIYVSGERGWDTWIILGVYIMIIGVVFKLSECFKFGHLKLWDIVVSQLIATFIVDFITYFQLCVMAHHMLSVWPMLLLFTLDMAICASYCYVFTRIYHSLYVPHKMLLIYGKENAQDPDSALDLAVKMNMRSDHYKVTRSMCVSDMSTETILDAIQNGSHDAVIINDIAGIKRNDILKYCYEHGVRTYLVPKISDIIVGGGQDINLFDTPLKLVKGRGLTLPERFMKRMMDIVLCLIAMIPATPIMLIIALAIKLEDHGPIFYKQKRVTRNGKVFEILKFRSMVTDAEKGGYDMTMRANGKDPRITKVGAVIRALRVDELPQIINILMGDMSIVGPRPERVEHVEAYAKDIPEWHLREKVKGGLTGYAQIYGRYNTSPMDKTKLDVMYIEHYSLFLDIKLIIMTIRILFSKESTEGFDANDDLKDKRQALKEELEQTHEQRDDDRKRHEFCVESPERSA